MKLSHKMSILGGIFLSTFLTAVKPIYAAENRDLIGAQSSQSTSRMVNTESNEFFPNYFAGIDQDTLEKLIGHVIMNASTVVYDPQSKTFKSDFLFRRINEISSNFDPSAKVYLSGGNIRSVFSFIYRHIDENLRKKSNSTVRQILNDFLLSKNPIPMSSWRGVGSDLDLLIESPTSSAKIIETVTSYINGSLHELNDGGKNISTEKLSFMRTAFLQGDVKEYEEQTTRSSEQGGSSLDWLAFDLKSHNFKLPTRDPEVIKNFLNGYYSYYRESKPGLRSDPDDTILRGARPLFELPFLKIKDEGVYTGELLTLVKKVKAGHSLSERSLKQIHKMVRNALWGGAKNRVYRATPEDKVDLALRELSDLMKSLNSHYYIPEYVDYIHREKDRANKKNEIPSDLRMNFRDFSDNYTENGILYHGTESMETALAILKGGFYVSSETQGLAAYGKGLYTSPSLELAESYSRDGGGGVFKIRVLEDQAPVIIDWSKVEDDPRIKQIISIANKTNRNVFDVLKEKHGVDIIVHEHVLVQNANVIESVNSESDFIKIYIAEKTSEIGEQLKQPDFLVDNFSKKFKEINDMRMYAASYGLDGSSIDALMIGYIQASHKAFKEKIENCQEIRNMYDHIDKEGEFYFKKLLKRFKNIADIAAQLQIKVEFVDWESFQREQAMRIYQLALAKAQGVRKFDTFKIDFYTAQLEVLALNLLENFLTSLGLPIDKKISKQSKLKIYKNLMARYVPDVNNPKFLKLKFLSEFIKNKDRLGVDISSLIKVDISQLQVKSIRNSFLEMKRSSFAFIGYSPEQAREMISILEKQPQTTEVQEILLMATQFGVFNEYALKLIAATSLTPSARMSLAEMIIEKLKNNAKSKFHSSRDTNLDSLLKIYVDQASSIDTGTLQKLITALFEARGNLAWREIEALKKILNTQKAGSCFHIFRSI